MTTWLIGNYPEGWRVAMAGAPVTDNLDQYNLGDGNVRRAYAFGGSPWTSADRMKAFMDQSPITYASRIRTPTLIMQNMGDYRVTPTHAGLQAVATRSRTTAWNHRLPAARS